MKLTDFNSFFMFDSKVYDNEQPIVTIIVDYSYKMNIKTVVNKCKDLYKTWINDDMKNSITIFTYKLDNIDKY